MTLTCDQVRKELALFLYGELSFDEEEQIQQHLDGCEACARNLASAQTLHGMVDEAEPALPDGLLLRARTGLREALCSETPVRAAEAQGLGMWTRLSEWLMPAAWVWKPAGAVALVALGFLGSRMTMTPGLTQMAGVAQEAGGQPVATRVRYIEPDASNNGTVQIVLDETHQRVVSGRFDDAPIRKLLLAAAKDPADPGLRVESVEMLCQRGLKDSGKSVEVRDVLLYSIEHDENPGVRLKAMEGLKAFAGSMETQKTLARVLLNDSNAGVRAQAIDLLISQKAQGPNNAMAGTLQELLRKEDNDYVRLRSQRALRDMNASQGIF